MKCREVTLKDFEIKSEEYEVPFVNLMAGYAGEQFITVIANSKLQKKLWLQNSNGLGVDAYRQKLQNHLVFFQAEPENESSTEELRKLFLESEFFQKQENKIYAVLGEEKTEDTESETEKTEVSEAQIMEKKEESEPGELKAEVSENKEETELAEIKTEELKAGVSENKEETGLAEFKSRDITMRAAENCIEEAGIGLAEAKTEELKAGVSENKEETELAEIKTKELKAGVSENKEETGLAEFKSRDITMRAAENCIEEAGIGLAEAKQEDFKVGLAEEAEIGQASGAEELKAEPTEYPAEIADEKCNQISMEIILNQYHIPFSIKIEPYRKLSLSSRRTELTQMFPQPEKVFYEQFPMEEYIAQGFYEILDKLELLNDLSWYKNIYDILNREIIEGRKVRDSFFRLVEESPIASLEKRLDTIRSYGNYRYMKKKWKNQSKREKEAFPEWEEMLSLMIAFFEPIFEAVIRDEIFFGDWMPQIRRFLE